MQIEQARREAHVVMPPVKEGLQMFHNINLLQTNGTIAQPEEPTHGSIRHILNQALRDGYIINNNTNDWTWKGLAWISIETMREAVRAYWYLTEGELVFVIGSMTPEIEHFELLFEIMNRAIANGGASEYNRRIVELFTYEWNPQKLAGYMSKFIFKPLSLLEVTGWNQQLVDDLCDMLTKSILYAKKGKLDSDAGK